MIRINLLGQIRPKSGRRPVDTGAAMPAIFLLSGAILGWHSGLPVLQLAEVFERGKSAHRRLNR